MTERNDGSGVRAGRRINRRDFLKMSGAGLAGAALLGASGCGGGGGGSGNVIFSMGPDDEVKTYTKLVDKFNKQHKGEFQVTVREMPADTGQYFDKLRTEFQAGGGDIDVIGGDTIWPIQFAAQGWVQDLSDKFPEPEQNKFLPAPIQASIYEDGIYGVPWYEDAGLLYSRSDLLEQAGYSAPPRPGTSSRRWPSRSRRTRAPRTASSSRERITRAGCATVWSTSGPTAAMSSPA